MLHHRFGPSLARSQPPRRLRAPRHLPPRCPSGLISGVGHTSHVPVRARRTCVASSLSQACTRVGLLVSPPSPGCSQVPLLAVLLAHPRVFPSGVASLHSAAVPPLVDRVLTAIGSSVFLHRLHLRAYSTLALQSLRPPPPGGLSVVGRSRGRTSSLAPMASSPAFPVLPIHVSGHPAATPRPAPASVPTRHARPPQCYGRGTSPGPGPTTRIRISLLADKIRLVRFGLHLLGALCL
jgi:hypothetical protein